MVSLKGPFFSLIDCIIISYHISTSLISFSLVLVWGDMAGVNEGGAQDSYQQAPVVVPMSGAGMSGGMGDFTFTSPSTMPPR